MARRSPRKPWFQTASVFPRPTPARAARDKELEARLASVESQQQQAATLSGIESERAARLELEQRTGRLEADLSEGLERLSAAGRPNVDVSVQQEHAEPPEAGGAAQAEKVDALAEELVLLDTTLAELATQVGTRSELTEIGSLCRVPPPSPTTSTPIAQGTQTVRACQVEWLDRRLGGVEGRPVDAPSNISAQTGGVDKGRLLGSGTDASPEQDDGDLEL